jgi:nicotinate-nucleotide pyrophosphorylase (carboxylating)
MFQLNQQDVQNNVSQALAEDLAGLAPDKGDITALLIPQEQRVRAKIITREPCVLAGQAWLNETFAQLDKNVLITWFANDGDTLQADQEICQLEGNARVILTGERTALNFLQTLSGTATVVASYVKYLAGSHTKLLDTRKTLPGLRMAQKYAVTCGGGNNHRIGLFDAFLIKENHIMACGSIAAAVQQARVQAKDKLVEVEVESLAQLQQALNAQADIVMLDNFSLKDVSEAVKINQGRCKLEVSGNITEQRLTELVNVGVDFISSGALTKNVQAIDLSLRIMK